MERPHIFHRPFNFPHLCLANLTSISGLLLQTHFCVVQCLIQPNIEKNVLVSSKFLELKKCKEKKRGLAKFYVSQYITLLCYTILPKTSKHFIGQIPHISERGRTSWYQGPWYHEVLAPTYIPPHCYQEFPQYSGWSPSYQNPHYHHKHNLHPHHYNCWSW